MIFNKRAQGLLAAFAFMAASSAFANTNPASALVTIYGVAVSPNADCSNAVVLNYSSSPTAVDFEQTPSLFSGSPSAGTYNCVVLLMSDQLTFTPAATTGNCTAGTTYSRVVCSGNCTYTTITNASSLAPGVTLTYGSTVQTSATTSQDLANATMVPLFISNGTSGTGQTGLAFTQPTGANATTAGIALSGAFVVPASSATFIVDFDNQVNGSQNPCDLGPPKFGFRSQ